MDVGYNLLIVKLIIDSDMTLIQFSYAVLFHYYGRW
jgi:hypothetical protein